MAETARLDVDQNPHATPQTPETVRDSADVHQETMNSRLQDVIAKVSATGNECWIENGVVNVELTRGGEIGNLLAELFELVQETSYGANFYC